MECIAHGAAESQIRLRKGASLVAQLVKNLPAMWETWVHSLDWEEPLEKGKATHSSIPGIFMGLVISQANKWEECSNYFKSGAEIPRN